MKTYKIYVGNTYKGCVTAQSKFHANSLAQKNWGYIPQYNVKPLR